MFVMSFYWRILGNMESKSINRYNTFCRSLKNLEKSRTADVERDFVLEGTVLNFSLTFDIAWKVMKDILVKEMGILDFATGSPRETLQQAFQNKIINDDRWIQMLRTRNQLAHDYDGTFAKEKFQEIIEDYYPLFEELKERVGKYYLL
ncbi:MAG: HI0074 family nucleotidyltransferase substrate-binding subunit [Blautia sp.]